MSEELPDGIIDVVKIYKIPIIMGGVSLFAIVISIILLVKSTQSASPIQFSSDQISSPSAVLGATSIKVDVEGAVNNPGLYSLLEGSRVEDAITSAGGLTTDVDQALFAKTVNRAMKLIDGGKLFIPKIGDTVIGSPVGSSNQSSLVSINTGSASELDTLAGVGAVTAQKIIDNRPYQTLEELVSKKAVGSALFEKIKSQISL